MRISDWSSDVCSSDLDRTQLVGIGLARVTGLRDRIPDRHQDTGRGHARGQRLQEVAPAVIVVVAQQPHLVFSTGILSSEKEKAADHSAADRSASTDRKRVVSGNSVSIRVDLGGRRIIIKKKHIKIIKI